jgi:hypothetical protein
MDALHILLRRLGEVINQVCKRLARKMLSKSVEIVCTNLELAPYLGDPLGSAAFERAHLATVPVFKSRDHLLRQVMRQAGDNGGLFLEFGVYKGDSINRLAQLRPDVTFYGFDSFVGLPATWTMHSRQGAFDVGGRKPPVRHNVELVVGFYEETLEAFLAERPDTPVRFLHVDCDLYSSTKTIFAHTQGRLRAGTIILFDEYFNYPGWQEGEYKAFMEFVTESGARFEYIGYCRSSEQMAVRLL